MLYVTAYHLNRPKYYSDTLVSLRGSDEVRYTTSVYARGPDHLKETLALRNLGDESVVSATDWGYPLGSRAPVMPSTHMRNQNWNEGLHALCWVGMIAVSAGIRSGFDLLKDTGLIHDVTHVVRGTSFEGNRGLIEAVEELERETPGVHPSWGGDDVAAGDEIVTPNYAMPFKVRF